MVRLLRRPQRDHVVSLQPREQWQVFWRVVGLAMILAIPFYPETHIWPWYAAIVCIFLFGA